MDWKKLAPWNWFKKEEEEGMNVPATRVPTEHATHYLEELQQEIDRVFNSFFRDWPLKMQFPSFKRSFKNEMGLIRPTLDLSAKDNAYLATLELPGVDPKDVKIELRKNNLFITGEKKQEEEHKERDHYRIERSYGMFRRVLTLPEDVNTDDISASYKNGVMTITIPRKAIPDSERRQIEVKAG
jgi:HSP20 family protein